MPQKGTWERWQHSPDPLNVLQVKKKTLPAQPKGYFWHKKKDVLAKLSTSDAAGAVGYLLAT